MYITYDLLTTAVVVLAAVLLLVSLFFWFKLKRATWMNFMWFIIIVLVPIFGPIFFLGFQAKRQ